MNITLSAEEKLIKKSRAVAAAKSTSLNNLIRQYLEQLTGAGNTDKAAKEFAVLATENSGLSPKGFSFNRDQAHQRQ